LHAFQVFIAQRSGAFFISGGFFGILFDLCRSLFFFLLLEFLGLLFFFLFGFFFL